MNFRQIHSIKENNANETESKLTAKQRNTLLDTWKARFEANPQRHMGIDWAAVQARLAAAPAKLASLAEMEDSGGEPDFVGLDPLSGDFLFVDCSQESPAGRRSLCYDRAGLESRKDHPPQTTAMDMAAAMGISLLTEAEYLNLQQLGCFDTKTSSWIATPPDIRSLGGALYAESRYGRTFIGHNGAQSYYAARGFRGMLRI